MTPSPLPAWPERDKFVTPTPYGDGMTMAQIADYETALTAFWESRCRVAVGALHLISGNWPEDPSATADEAISTIGELPPTEVKT